MMMQLVVPLLALVVAVSGTGYGLLGAPMDADINDKEVQDALQFAVAQHNKLSNCAYLRQVVKILKAQVQVVSGLKYIFEVKMARTSCRKGGAEETCAIAPNAPVMTCKFAVWSQPWLNSVKLVQNTCK